MFLLYMHLCEHILRHLKSITFDLCTKVYKMGEIVDKEIKKWRV